MSFAKCSHLKSYLLLGFVYLGVLIFNYGFMGTDEYWVGMVKYLPAQTAPWADLVTAEDVKSPIQLMPFFGIAQIALKLGIEDAYIQYRFVQAFLAIFAVLLSVFAFRAYTRNAAVKRKSDFSILVGIFCLHAFIPGIVSRPMFEALSMPWLLLSAVFGTLYLENSNQNRKGLFLSVLFAGVAFLLRPQTGLCAAVAVVLPMLGSNNRNQKVVDLICAGALGLAIFLVAGIPDIFWHNEYHYSLKAITIHNYQHGAAYNAQPWYFYFPIAFAFFYGPFLFKRYDSEFWKEFNELKVPAFFLIAFFVTHLVFANKFERFLFPWFGVMVLLMEPFVRHFKTHYQEHKLRVFSLLLLNFLIWIPASFGAAQKNLIDLPVYLNKHSEIDQVWLVDRPVEWFAQILVQRSVHIDDIDFSAVQQQPNPGYYLVNANQYAANKNFWSKCQETQSFRSNFLDEMAYRFNPAKNQRRAPLILLNCRFNSGQ